MCIYVFLVCITITSCICQSIVCYTKHKVYILTSINVFLVQIDHNGCIVMLCFLSMLQPEYETKVFQHFRPVLFMYSYNIHLSPSSIFFSQLFNVSTSLNPTIYIPFSQPYNLFLLLLNLQSMSLSLNPTICVPLLPDLHFLSSSRTLQYMSTLANSTICVPFSQYYNLCFLLPTLQIVSLSLSLIICALLPNPTIYVSFF